MENSWRNEKRKKRLESQLEHRMTGTWKRRTKSCIALSTYRSTIPSSKAFARSFFPRFFLSFLLLSSTPVSLLFQALISLFLSNLFSLSNRCHLRTKAIIDTEKYTSTDQRGENQIENKINNNKIALKEFK